VCSITEIMPRTLVNNDPRSRLRPGAEIGLHRVDELVGIVEHEGQEPNDAVAWHRGAGRPFCNERLPRPLEDGP
jgi:hypothetical protein